MYTLTWNHHEHRCLRSTFPNSDWILGAQNLRERRTFKELCVEFMILQDYHMTWVFIINWCFWSEGDREPLALVCCKTLCSASPFLHGWWGGCGQQIHAHFQGCMKQIPARRSREPAHQQHLGPENQDGQHMLNQPWGLSLIAWNATEMTWDMGIWNQDGCFCHILLALISTSQLEWGLPRDETTFLNGYDRIQQLYFREHILNTKAGPHCRLKPQSSRISLQPTLGKQKRSKLAMPCPSEVSGLLLWQSLMAKL